MLDQWIGRRARVHWHVTKKIYSVKVSGHPVFYARSVTLADCKFVIDARLRAMFDARPQRRTVHALVAGTIQSFDTQPIGGELVRCSPFRYRTFVRASNEQPVWSANQVALHSDCRIEAKGLV